MNWGVSITNHYLVDDIVKNPIVISNGMMTRDVGLPLVRALHAFKAGRYGEAVEGLRRIKGIAVRFGGSNAQRDLIHWTMTEAALREGDRATARGFVKQRRCRRWQRLGFELAATLQRVGAVTRDAPFGQDRFLHSGQPQKARAVVMHPLAADRIG